MTKWTIQTVTDRFSEAARTAHRLPSVRVQGYFNCWPAIKRQPWENLGAEPRTLRLAPNPADIDRMLETMRWVRWLDEDQRHLIWMRADRLPWKHVCSRFGCNRTTAWRRWQKALQIVASKLNKEVKI